MSTRWPSVASFLMALAVCAGAFAAHSLKNKLEPYYLGVFEKAVFYHFIHALGIFLVSSNALSGALSSQQSNRICSLLFFGIVFFSGSLYLLSLLQISWLGAITPLGGVAFIIAWLLTGYYLW